MVNKRAEYILGQLEDKGIVKVNELSQELNCSEVTIRSDIKRLDQKGLLKRTHGGAVKMKDLLTLQINPGNVTKNVAEKERIAAKAYSYIEEQDTIILDDSSVNYYLAKEILANEERHIVVITNSLAVASVLSGADHVALFMIGGQIGGKLPSSMGEMAIETISKFKAEKAFISAHGISFDAGVTAIGSPQMQVKKAILEVVDDVYVEVDSSKFSGGYVMVVCPLERIKRIITDDGLDEESRRQAEDKNLPIDIV